MITKTLAQLKDQFAQQGIMLCFNGCFTHGIIEELGKAVRQYLESEELSRSSLMDVFSVFIEQTQNVRNYTTHMPIHDPEQTALVQSAIVLIGKQGEKYWICSGNYIAMEDIAPLTARIDELNGLDKAELKQRYKTQLRQELPEGSLGAGLGLLDIARRMSEPFVYNIEPVNEQYAFFSLRVII